MFVLENDMCFCDVAFGPVNTEQNSSLETAFVCKKHARKP